MMIIVAADWPNIYYNECCSSRPARITTQPHGNSLSHNFPFTACDSRSEYRSPTECSRNIRVKETHQWHCQHCHIYHCTLLKSFGCLNCYILNGLLIQHQN